MISFLYVWFFITASGLIGYAIYKLMKIYVWTKKRMYEDQAVELLRSKIEHKVGRDYSKAFSPFYREYHPWAEKNGKKTAPLSTARQALSPKVKHVSKPDMIVDMLGYCGEEIEIIEKAG